MRAFATTTNAGLVRTDRRLNTAPMRGASRPAALPHAPMLPLAPNARRAGRSSAGGAAPPAAPPSALPTVVAATASPILVSVATHAALGMVNVDFASPSLVLGAALIGCGIVLLQARNLQRRVSRDADIVVAAMVSIVGSTLIFQGWRLDPLLLLCQALTTSVAVWYGLETFRLRAQVMDEDPQAPPGQLPPPAGDPGAYYDSSYGGRPAAPPGSYLPPGVERPPAPWDAAAGGQWGAAPRAYEEASPAVVAYDYYGNPIPPAGAAGAAGTPGDAAGYDPAGDYASIAAGAAAAAAAAAAAGAAGPSGRAGAGYYDPGAPPGTAYGPPGDAGGYGEVAPGSGYGGYPAAPGSGYGGADGYGNGYPPGGPPPPQQQQGGMGPQQQWRPARRDGAYDAVDDF